MNSNNVLTFAKLVGLVKNVKRTGWLRFLKPEQVESVA
jgi:5'-deoxynucleotidase YfbR-like HD superfamily hydrolase